MASRAFAISTILICRIEKYLALALGSVQMQTPREIEDASSWRLGEVKASLLRLRQAATKLFVPRIGTAGCSNTLIRNILLNRCECIDDLNYIRVRFAHVRRAIRSDF